MEEICASQSEACQEFVAANLEELQTVLTDSQSLSACAPSTLNVSTGSNEQQNQFDN
jgi:hypothetical protein